MFANRESMLLGNFLLPLFDLGIVELLDAATIETDQMVVVGALVEFEDRLARLKMVALQQARLFELGQHPVDRGQPDVEAVSQQMAIHIFGRDMARGTLILQLVKQVENLQPWVGGLEADAL